MKVKDLQKVLSDNVKVTFFDNYGGTDGIYNSKTIPGEYENMKIEKIWTIYSMPELKITIDGVIK